MYIRFETYIIDHRSRRYQGIFQAAGDVVLSDTVEPHIRARIREILAYFNKSLYIPKCVKTRSNSRALSYFKPTAVEMIREMRELVALMKDHGLHVKIVYKRELARIIYEDKHQVVAFR